MLVFFHSLLFFSFHFSLPLSLRKLEAGAYDASDFLKWQSEMRQNDLEKELMAIEERKLKGKLSHEEAILARTNLVTENQSRVQAIKEEVRNSFFCLGKDFFFGEFFGGFVVWFDELFVYCLVDWLIWLVDYLVLELGAIYVFCLRN